MRCEATTKKKRGCAIDGAMYCAVDGKRYCHIHHPHREYARQQQHRRWVRSYNYTNFDKLDEQRAETPALKDRF